MIYYDKALVGHSIDIKRTFRGVYYVYIDNQFYCSAESMREAEDEVDEYVEENNLRTAVEVL